MIDINKSQKDVSELLKNRGFTTPIKIYMSHKTVGDDFDSREKNYTYSNLNPITIRGYVRTIKSESLAWKSYGFVEVGAKEIIADSKYLNYFMKANKIVIDDGEYQVFKHAVGNRAMVDKRSFNTIRVILRKIK
jgi:hypothetical protein